MERRGALFRGDFQVEWVFRGGVHVGFLGIKGFRWCRVF